MEHFLRLFRETAPILFALLRRARGYGGSILVLNPQGPYGGQKSEEKSQIADGAHFAMRKI